MAKVKDKIQKTAREKQRVINKGASSTVLPSDFSAETL